ncbi:MAG: Fur family transcriptional regulator [Clostridia bacterium]
MIDKKDIYKKLKARGQRITRQKIAILDILLDNTDTMLSAGEIRSRIPGDIKIDDATIYRNVQGFADVGILESMIDSSGLNLYKLCDSSPHHHLICTECGRIINFPCRVDFWKPYLKENNFIESHHVIEIYGKCSECANK